MGLLDKLFSHVSKEVQLDTEHYRSEQKEHQLLKRYLVPQKPYIGKHYKDDAPWLLRETKSYAESINKSETVSDFERSFKVIVSNLQKLMWINEIDHIPMSGNPRQNLEKILLNMEATIDDFINRVKYSCHNRGVPTDMIMIADDIETSDIFNEFLTPNNRKNIEKMRLESGILQKKKQEKEARFKKVEEQKKRLKKVGFSPALDLSDIDGMTVVLALEHNLQSVYNNFLHFAYSPSKGHEEFENFKRNCQSSKLPLMAEVRLESLLEEFEPKFSLETPLYAIDHMEGHEFERWCAALLKRNGFVNVEVTQDSNDQGVDVIAIKDGVRYAIQCKCYSSDLGNKSVQEVHTGKYVHRCHVGVVMTNRYFTAGAKQAAEATGTLLWDRDKLEEMLDTE